MSKKCKWCARCVKLHTLPIIDCSANTSKSRELPAHLKLCLECLDQYGFACGIHKRIKLCVYDNNHDNDPAALSLFHVCLDCVKDSLDELNHEQLIAVIDKVYSCDPEIADTLASERKFGVPDESTFERRVLYNLLVSAQLEDTSIEDLLSRMEQLAESAETQEAAPTFE